MTQENYDKVRVSPSGAVIASKGGFSSGRTWMWQGIPTTSFDIETPVPASDYAQGLGPAGQEGEPLLVDIKPYAGSGLVYDIKVDALLSVQDTEATMVISVVGSNDAFASSTVLAFNELPISNNASGIPLNVAARMHITDLAFTSKWKQVAVLFQGVSLAYTPADVALVIKEFGTN